MKFLDDIVNEFDIALKTLSNKKSGTGRTYPPEPVSYTHLTLPTI